MGGYTSQRALVSQLENSRYTISTPLASPLSSTLLGLFIAVAWYAYVDGLMQERRNSIANTLKLRLSCTNPSMCYMSHVTEVAVAWWLLVAWCLFGARTSATIVLTVFSQCISMMTSLNGNIFRVTDHLCGEFTGHRWIPCTKASDSELWCFFDLHLNKRLSKQS